MKIKYSALWLSLICVVVYLIQITFSGFTELLLLDSNSFNEPWRYLSAIFLHANFSHLFFNIFALALFGSILEKEIGTKRFLIVFFVSGIVANLIASFFYSSSLGASGAIFGVIGAIILLKPLMMVFSAGLPMPMILAGLFWIIGDVSGLFAADSTGHIAHLIGVAIGFIFGLGFKKRISDKPQLYLNEKVVQEWEDQYLR